MDDPVVLNLIRDTKKRFIAGIMEDELFKLVTQGKVAGKSPRGRKRLNLLSNL